MWLLWAKRKIFNFFLNLEKSHAVQNQIRNILINSKEINDQKDINNELYFFYKNIFSKNIYQSKTRIYIWT